jgi:hypothetical protein
MLDVRHELVHRGILVGPALYEKCLFGSGIYPLGENMVVKAELASTDSHIARMMKESTYMLNMASHGIGPKIRDIGSFKVRGEDQTLVYIIMDKFVVDLGIIEMEMPSTLLDSTTGFMIHNLFKKVAYETRMILTDLKPQNIVANLDLVFPREENLRLRISRVGLIDFGTEYCAQLPTNIHPRTAHTAMVLLYFAISSAVGSQRCAELILPYIKRRKPDNLSEAIMWMDIHPVINMATRQYVSSTRTVSDIYTTLVQNIRK